MPIDIKAHKVPDELISLSMEGPGDTLLVPFPIGEANPQYFQYKSTIVAALNEVQFIIIRHPESKVGIIAWVSEFVEEGNLLRLQFDLVSRVSILALGRDDSGNEVVKWSEFKEVVAGDVLIRPNFQRKVDKLCKLAAEIAKKFNKDFIIPPDRTSPEIIVQLIDEVADEMGVFSDEKTIKKFLLMILQEDDIEKRLDKALDLYAFCSKNIDKLVQESPLRTEENLIGIKFKMKRDKLPPDVMKIIETELARIENVGPNSPEHGIVENYVERLLNFPWGVYTDDTKDLVKVEATLNDDHFGLLRAKERILEFLAVRQLNPRIKAPILLFVGPPGVGKTSIGESIARALGRKFIRTSLGGIDDEAEIRGHRRTYVAAIPGRIVELITRVQSLNPVFMLDEVDKVGHGHVQGNPQDALLEVLDPERNSSFVDTYFGVDVDLSKVLFIATANSVDNIPEPLLDRMEVIEFTSYTEQEKIEIAKRFLILKQLKENGLSVEQFRERGEPPINVEITEDALRAITNDYAIEAGVRDLEKKIAGILRKIVRKIKISLEETHGSLEINESNLVNYLGNPDSETIFLGPLPVGVSSTLAVWGGIGVVNFVEAAFRENAGRRKIKVTGVKGSSKDEGAGRVMEESVDIAWDFLFKDGGLLQGRLNENTYLRIHFSDGSMPKDGPSAGVPVLWALYSLFTNQPVKPYLAATGEITLNLDKVCRIGGAKEKIFGALRAGAKQVLIPRSNINDIKDIPPEVKAKLEIILCDSMMESLRIAFPNCEILKKIAK